MSIPPERFHGDSGHLQDHNNINSTLSTHNSYLDQGVKSTDSPTFSAINFGSVQTSAAVVSINNNNQTTVDSFDINLYRTAEYSIQINQNTKYVAVKATVIHDGVDSGISEYGKVEMGDPVTYSLSSDISGSNCILSISVSDAEIIPATVKVLKSLINI